MHILRRDPGNNFAITDPLDCNGEIMVYEAEFTLGDHLRILFSRSELHIGSLQGETDQHTGNE